MTTQKTLNDLGFTEAFDVEGRASITDLFKPNKRCDIYVLHFSKFRLTSKPIKLAKPSLCKDSVDGKIGQVILNLAKTNISATFSSIKGQL